MVPGSLHFGNGFKDILRHENHPSGTKSTSGSIARGGG